MSRHLITIRTQADRDLAVKYVAAAPPGTRVEFKATKRSLLQNDRLWANLSDISRQLRWHGQKLTPNDWKLMFLDALKRELRMVSNLDGNGFVNLGRSSSDLTKQEMSDLFEIIEAFAANHGVILRDKEEAA